MQREKDYLKKKIDKLAVMLAELLAKVTKTEVAFTKEEFAIEFDKILTDETNLTVAKILEIEEIDFLKVLREEYKFNSNQLHILADLLYQYSLNFENDKLNLNSKIVTLYETSITEGIALSLEKYKLIDKLKKM
ncbi:hypothetical protein Fleli_0465 [Bernardetia litoralis DSM 6794]|uniref:Uncharacterized protein n=1 Tax=Bernardetia litoralis (strain ATCC 23117 / DSM 6794 / NBRC 15988 / NCIMB 1366 / Fx l1 / Sio-4) TaxID=880071 RepID=I4AG56_BERLS|nr:hypothetical protein [Bernardetia litoralis]AFM02941.1 hypothetical protein Fleli_0465 [Bernardetia litoralis DSM 6794]